jgi:membrane associated rhomboid family serine protease
MQRVKPRPLATTLLLLVSGIVFFVFVADRTSFAAARFVGSFGFIPEVLRSADQWYRLGSSIFVYENSFFLAVASIFLIILGGPFENRQGTRHFVEIFIGATIASFAALSLLTWGQEFVLAGGLAGTGGMVGAWALEACRRRRKSYHPNVLVRDFEELPVFLVLALWFFALFAATILFSPDPAVSFSIFCISTAVGGVIHLARSHGRSKLKT